jgi:hypothetical protein
VNAAAWIALCISAQMSGQIVIDYPLSSLQAALAEFRISGPKFTLADALNTIKR